MSFHLHSPVVLLLGASFALPGTASLVAAEERSLPYAELEGVAEDFSFRRDWNSYYWREDFTFVLRDDSGERHRVISREPTPWTDLRLGTTFTGLKVDWAAKPRVRVIGVRGIDRIPETFYDLKLDARHTVTAFIVRVQDGPDRWRDYFINNWFHAWGKDTDRKVLAHYAKADPHYTVYGYLGGIAAPFDAEGKKLLAKYEPDYAGIIYHGQVVKADGPAGYEVHILHLMGRHKKSMEYAVFVGDGREIPRLDSTPRVASPRFTDVTAASGLNVPRDCKPHAVAVEDFDGDGLLDVLLGTFDPPHLLYFRNLGGLKFRDVTKGSGLEAFKGQGTGFAVGDYDRDGRLDVFVASLKPGESRLFHGERDGAFTDVTAKAGLAWDGPARSCAWSDYDRDGWLDLYVATPEGGGRLFHNRGNGTFTDVTRAAGVALPRKHLLGCAFGDFDGDGLDDLFVTAYDSQSSVLFKNLGDGTFRDVTATAGLGRRASSVGCAFGDVLGLGRLDLYVTTDSWLSGANYTEKQLLEMKHTVEPNLLYLGDGKGKFRSVEEATLALKTLSHDVVLEDLDHDGKVEIYVGVDAESGNQWATSKGGNPLWTRGRGDKWQEVSKAWGVAHESNCVCVPAADFDNDGDLDLLLINFYTRPVLYRNNTDDKHWLRVKAVGAKSNPNSIGARVSVYTADKGNRRLVGFRHIQSGAGYCRSSPLEAHFGLGEAAPADGFEVEVRFPGGKRVLTSGVQPGRVIVIREP